MKNYKVYIDKNNITNREMVLDLIKKNPDNLSLEELSIIAETINNNRTSTAAYYTDDSLLEEIKKELPTIDKKIIRILEPSVGIGNFIYILIEKYKLNEKVIIDVVDIDKKSLVILDALNAYREIPENFEINYINSDFLQYKTDLKYDLVVGNPPYFNMNKSQGLDFLRKQFDDNENKNIAGFFMHKSLTIADNVFLVMPKYLFHNKNFSILRDKMKEKNIKSIIDFGEKGFKGVLIETIAVLISPNTNNNYTKVSSLTKNINITQLQSYITDDLYPSWIIYRNEFFDEQAKNLKFGEFSVFRDRQITNKILFDKGEILVLRSQNIRRDGSGFSSIEKYDKYTNINLVNGMKVFSYFNRGDVYLSPNMTYYPRVIKKPKNTLVNGSIAILELKNERSLTDEQLKYLSSPEFEEFYKIARNYSTRSLNIDETAIFYFGVLDNCIKL